MGGAQLTPFCAWSIDAAIPVTWKTTVPASSRIGPLTQLIGRAVTAWNRDAGNPQIRLVLGKNVELTVDCSVPCGLDDVFDLVVGRSHLVLTSSGSVRHASPTVI